MGNMLRDIITARVQISVKIATTVIVSFAHSRLLICHQKIQTAMELCINSLCCGVNLCLLKCHNTLITFAISLEPDQARHIAGADLDPNCLIL